MELKIKVCGITDPSNATEIATLRVDFMGFIFYPGSTRYVGPSPSRELLSCNYENIGRTGVFVDDDHRNIISTVEEYSLDYVQLHGTESVNYCLSLKRAGIKIIKAFKVGSVFDLLVMNDYMDVCDYFLFDTGTGKEGGSGKKFDWTLIYGYHLPKPFFLAGGIGPSDVRRIRELSYPFLHAIDLNSNFEVSPGVKNIEALRSFINELKSENQ
jgi:phosphoribosylanthranilate isomerase